MLEYRYAYLIGSLIALALWAFLYWRRKDLRREMLTLSIITASLAPTNILYFGTYWKPEFVFDIYNFGIESIIVCFAYGGICGVIYEFVYRKYPMRKLGVNTELSKLEVLTSFTLGLVATIALTLLTDLNVIYTTSSGVLITGVLFIYFRCDLLRPGIISGLISVIISIAVYWILLCLFPNLFDRFWIADNISNIRVLFIPIEEYYFHFAIGLALGILYEMQFGLYDKSVSHKDNSAGTAAYT